MIHVQCRSSNKISLNSSKIMLGTHIGPLSKQSFILIILNVLKFVIKILYIYIWDIQLYLQ